MSHILVLQNFYFYCIFLSSAFPVSEFKNKNRKLFIFRFQSVKYSLRCLVATDPTSESANRIRDSETRLSEKKKHLETFQSEFCDIKKKYEEACSKLGKDIEETQDLIGNRERAYQDFVAESASKYTDSPMVQHAAASSNKGRLFGKIFS